MKIEGKIIDALIALSSSNGNVITENIIFDYCDKEGLSINEISRVCEKIQAAGVKIVSQAEYDNAVKSQVTTKDIITKEDIIVAFKSLGRIQQKECFSALTEIMNDEEDHNEPKIQDFVERLNKMYVQYSYIAVLVKSFFSCNINDGCVSFDELAERFYWFYKAREKQRLTVEKEDSIFSKKDMAILPNDVKSLILYNPLGRSFLKKYFTYDKSKNIVFIDKSLWEKLDIGTIEEVKTIVDKRLNEYYSRLDTQKQSHKHYEEKDILVFASKVISAKAYIYNDQFIVMKGSHINKELRNSCRKNIKKYRQELMDSGKIVDWVFAEDVIFSSPSAAAAVIVGGEANGLISWRNSQGQLLRYVYSNNMDLR